MDNAGFIAELVEPVSRFTAYKQVIGFSKRLSKRRLVNAVAIGAMDALALSLAVAITGVLRLGLLEAPLFPWAIWVLVPVWWLGAGLTGLLPGWGLSTVEHFRRQVVLLSILFSGILLITILTKAFDIASGLSIAAAWTIAVVIVPVGRTLARHMLCVRKIFGMPTIIFGRADVAAELVERLGAEQGLGYSPVGVCTDDPVDSVAGLKVVGRMNQVSPGASAAIVAIRGIGVTENEALLTRVLRAYRSVLILPDVSNVPSLFVLSRDLGGAVGLEISQAILSPFATKVKRGADIALVVATAPAWLTLVGVIHAAIWLVERKNPIFRQERAGREGRAFHAIKFRTMVPDAETVLKRHLAADSALRAEWEANYKLKKDPRITMIGRFLRRSSLDELPQLFNVLRGEMSLVGPRPLPVYHLEKLPIAVREIRHEVRPGLTGLWQVSGRSDAGNSGMVRWDPYYVRNWSPWLDIVILVRTVRVVLQGSGAR